MMYLYKLKLWNFRKYGTNGKEPGLIVEFKDRLNVLIGENDSGKTAIIDAIRYVLNTKGLEQIRFDEKDFYQTPNGDRASEFDIECLFSGMKPEEAANFLEWSYFNEQNDYELRVHLRATRHSNNRITYDIKAGPENADTQMDGNARELLKVTYLKPLRDAEQELTPSYRSRLAQILLSHEDFKKKSDIDGKLQNHAFEEIIKEANAQISKVLNEADHKVISTISKYIKKFLHDKDPRRPELKIANPELQRILKTLSLELEDNTSGLGTLNKLFMAAELLHLGTEQYNGLKLCLIEELEAHLHPQAQLRVIKALEDEESTQIILSTHSTTLGASIKLDHLILCHGNDVYPLWKDKTELEEVNYKFLERFLDATKANLFFARGVILVEGDAENILIPTIAELIDKPLHKYGVSIVNVGSTAFLHYAQIFMRKDGKKLNIPVAVVTDLDVRAMEYYEDQSMGGYTVFS
jgi:putative ATP-dependent endonuclease of the OLD family